MIIKNRRLHLLFARWRKLRRRQRIGLIALALILIGAMGAYFWLFAGLPSLDDLSAGLSRPSTRIYDRSGKLLYEVVDPYGGRNTSVTLAQIPASLIHATIDTEDGNFYHESLGFDPISILRAAWIDLRGGDLQSGGSTITQQLARDLLLPDQRTERTLTRKLRELILSVELSGRYSRDQILALYLNQTYYGHLAYGVQAASQAYFAADVGSLDLAQAALLAGLPQAPALYDPLSDPVAAHDRQQTVLHLMVTAGDLTQAQADDAAQEPLQYASGHFAVEAPHFVFSVLQELSQRFPDALARGGLSVTTTLNLDWEHSAESIITAQLTAINQTTDGSVSHHASDSALVAIDPHTGEVLASVGSADYFNKAISGSVDMTHAPRQPGSALKPFTYSLAFDPTQPDPWTPSTMLLDISTPFITKRLESYTPANYGLAEHGPVSIREALANSYNIPAVVTLDKVGIPNFVDLLHKLGITTLNDPSRIDLSITLGGGAVRLIDLTGAYTAFANNGSPVTPVDLLTVRDSDGNLIYQYQPPAPPPPVIDPRIAFLINNILSDNNAREPEFGTHSELSIGRVAAAKTGTTTDFRDNWTIGYTPDLTVGVWVGNADNSPMVNISGVSGAGPIWNQFMRAALAGQPDKAFPEPAGVHQTTVCALSGLLPTPYCPQTRVDWFIDGTDPTQPDNIFRPITIDRLTGQLATAQTPADRRFTQVFTVLPPEAHDWAIAHGIPQPPGSANSAVSSASTPTGKNPASNQATLPPLRMLSPDPYTIYQITPIVPADSQQIQFTAAAPDNTTQITYQIDGQPIGSADSSPWAVWWTLSAGSHQVVAVATLADKSQQTSAPIPFQVNRFVPDDQRPTAGAYGSSITQATPTLTP